MLESIPDGAFVCNHNTYSPRDQYSFRVSFIGAYIHETKNVFQLENYMIYSVCILGN